MIDHISIGVRDIARTRRFYDAALAPLGYTCLSPGDSSLGCRTGEPALARRPLTSMRASACQTVKAGR